VAIGAMQRFPNVTEQRFAVLQRRALDFGLTLKTESGTTSQRGFTVYWKYDPAGKALEIQCLNKPFLVPWGAVDKKIATWVDQ